ncbi:MAG: hypothetical protein EOO59_10920 [Hymenobacter sp.]|nr:MAG: hypothetical protein EOO59_10920 [Hymenobacter sp.]
MPSPAPTTVFTNAAGTLLTHPAGYAVVRYHAGTLQLPDLQALVTRLGELLLQHGWYKMLLDLRALPIISESIKDWTRTHWQQAGVPRPPVLAQATLLPANVFSRLAVSQLQLGGEGDIDIRNFPEEAAAHAYLVGLPAAPLAHQPPLFLR